VSTYRGEAPVLLEQAAAGIAAPPPYPLDAGGGAVSFRPVMEAIVRDMGRGAPAGYISARFHATLAHLFLEKSRLLMAQTGAGEVVLSGGCFQNKYLTELLQRLFASEGIPLCVPSRIPCNDGGVSVGQLVIAASRTHPD
jgi:hydrogenase maturation protein HypF